MFSRIFDANEVYKLPIQPTFSASIDEDQKTTFH